MITEKERADFEEAVLLEVEKAVTEGEEGRYQVKDRWLYRRHGGRLWFVMPKFIGTFPQPPKTCFFLFNYTIRL